MSLSAKPCVSIVIPVRNRPELLDRALTSLVGQTMSDVEIIVVDDHSDVPVTLDPWRGTIPVRVVRNERALGAQRSRLIGTALARGENVALLDSDDWWSPEKLQKQLAVLGQNDDVVVACRVVAVRGQTRKAAPWRHLREGERVEDFLYVERGMLQTSTMMAKRGTMVSLLEVSADCRVHNDTMLFLEAQRRGLRIIQLPDPLSYFDDNPRPDRVSYDADRVQASEAWFRAVSHSWSKPARRGFMLTDMVTRYVNTGQRAKAFGTLLRAFHPKVGVKLYVKKFVLIVCNGPPLRFIRYER